MVIWHFHREKLGICLNLWRHTWINKSWDHCEGFYSVFKAWYAYSVIAKATNDWKCQQMLPFDRWFLRRVILQTCKCREHLEPAECPVNVGSPCNVSALFSSMK